MNNEQKVEWLENEIKYCDKMINDYAFRKSIAEKELSEINKEQ